MNRTGSRPFESGHDPRRNREGRPKGGRRLVREVLGDDETIVLRYLASIFRNEQARASDRIAAGGWLACVAFGVHPGRSHTAADDRQDSRRSSLDERPPVVDVPPEQVQPMPTRRYPPAASSGGRMVW